MAIFGNFKGTTQSDFQIGKSSSSGSKLSTGTLPVSGMTNGDLYVDAPNTSIKVYNNAWVSIGSTLSELNVDSGTLFVDSTSDTVSIGSTSSNDKLFVNGSLRLGTNPQLKFSGAYLDVQHANGSATQLRVRDNGSSSDPIFKVYNASNSAEVFKVQGSTTTVTGDIAISGNITGADTDNLSEGTTNVYYTTARANSAIDAKITGDITLGNITAESVSTGAVSGVIFEPITDYGQISTSANVTVDYGTVTGVSTMPQNGEYGTMGIDGISYTKVYTYSTLPSASLSGPGATAMISDSDSRETGDLLTANGNNGGGSHFISVMSNGTAWIIG